MAIKGIKVMRKVLLDDIKSPFNGEILGQVPIMTLGDLELVLERAEKVL